MSPVDPPLLSQRQITLEEVEQISTGHCPPCEKMSAHPAFFEVVGCDGVGKNMNKKLSTWFQKQRYFRH